MSVGIPQVLDWLLSISSNDKWGKNWELKKGINLLTMR
jgi:hypothetical protein